MRFQIQIQPIQNSVYTEWPQRIFPKKANVYAKAKSFLQDYSKNGSDDKNSKILQC